MDTSRRGFWWLVTAILAPFGILGGPIAIASMLDGLIEWNGPAGYAVNLWDTSIRPPFANLLNWLVSKFSIHSVPEFLVDYVILSLLATTSYLRAVYLVPKNSILHTIGNSFVYLFTWPIALVLIAYSITKVGVKSWPRLLLTLAPFLGFFALWVLNFVFS